MRMVNRASAVLNSCSSLPALTAGVTQKLSPSPLRRRLKSTEAQRNSAGVSSIAVQTWVRAQGGRSSVSRVAFAGAFLSVGAERQLYVEAPAPTA
jgi:hypothetical protein